MELDKVLTKINADRNKVEACFVFSLWKDPELYEDYQDIDIKKNAFLTDKDAMFYFMLGKAMYQQGYRIFDHVTLETFLEHKPEIYKRYNQYGGYHEIEQLMSIVSADNVEAYYDKIARMNSLTTIANKYNELFNDVGRFDNATNEDVYNTFELLNSSVSISSTEKIEDLVITDGFIQGLLDGDDMGFNYGKFIPLGVGMKLPEGYEAHIVPRSSTFKNYGIIQLNHMGVVDSSYSGDNDQWMMSVYALRDTEIHMNERICQFRIVKEQPEIEFVEVDHLGNVDRGGFGTSGKQ